MINIVAPGDTYCIFLVFLYRVYSVDATLGLPVPAETTASIDLPPPPSIQLGEIDLGLVMQYRIATR